LMLVLECADVPLRNYSLTHSLTHVFFRALLCPMLCFDGRCCTHHGTKLL